VDAFSSRYKSTTQLHVFDDAVRHYRNQRLGHAQQQQQQQQQQGRHDRQNLNDRLNRSISRSQLRQPVQDHLRTLPHEILDCARTLDERLRFFNSQEAIGRETNTKESTRNQASIPLSLARLLDEITDVKQLPDRVRHEILCDNNARQVSLLCLGVASIYS
jgi:predicted KAP-like P-loop ATPase